MNLKEQQIKIMRDLDVNAFCAFLKENGHHQPRNDRVALMAIHKARIKSADISKEMKEESKSWLISEGCARIG